MKKITLLFFTLLGFSSFLHAQLISISEARMQSIGDTVTVTGTVTNGDEFGIIRYFQDGTAGIAAYGSALNSVSRNDSVTITGILYDFSSLLELSPVISVTNHGQAEEAIVPSLVTADELGEDLESELIQIENVVFADGGETFSGSSNYSYTADGEEGTIRINSGTDLVGEVIPVGPITLIGLLGQYSFTGFGGYQVLPRDINDVINDSPINIISSISQTDLTTSGFNLSWQTDVDASTGVYYSTDQFADTSAMEVVFIDESVSDHSIELSGLVDGTVYFARVFSVLGSDTTISNINAFATVSLSSGEMVVLFNFPVNHSVASSDDNLAIYTTQIDDSVASWIDKSVNTLDIAMYNLNRPVIQDAINDAYDRGVQVRYIAEGNNANIGLNYLNLNIPVLERENAVSSGMHNKFMIIDADSTAGAWIMGGSTNFTSNMIDDPNNMIFIQDQSLARSYRVEFEEMWGSNGAQPIAANSKFGENKANNTPHKFLVNGDQVELYFSPSDGTTQAIIETLETADASVDFSTLVFTRDDIAESIIQLNYDFFVTVSGIIEQINVTGSEYQVLVDEGVNVLSYQDLPGQLHHKLAIVDHASLNDDPLVLTGSHNWSSAAETSNDENILIIHNADIANQYYQEYSARYNELTVGINEVGEEIHMVIYPNPAQDKIAFIASDFSGDCEVVIYDASGKLIQSTRLNTQLGEEKSIDISSFNTGIYQLTIRTQTGQTNLKFIKN